MNSAMMGKKYRGAKKGAELAFNRSNAPGRHRSGLALTVANDLALDRVDGVFRDIGRQVGNPFDTLGRQEPGEHRFNEGGVGRQFLLQDTDEVLVIQIHLVVGDQDFPGSGRIQVPEGNRGLHNGPFW